jgi:hypothetical protein
VSGILDAVRYSGQRVRPASPGKPPVIRADPRTPHFLSIELSNILYTKRFPARAALRRRFPLGREPHIFIAKNIDLSMIFLKFPAQKNAGFELSFMRHDICSMGGVSDRKFVFSSFCT